MWFKGSLNFCFVCGSTSLMPKDYPWLYIQELLFVGLRNHLGWQGSNLASLNTKQMPYSIFSLVSALLFSTVTRRQILSFKRQNIDYTIVVIII